MQSHEGVRVAPVPADAVAPVDQGHAYVGVVDQRVDETHAHGPRTDHEVVGIDRVRHAYDPSTRAASRPSSLDQPARGAGVQVGAPLLWAGEEGR